MDCVVTCGLQLDDGLRRYGHIDEELQPTSSIAAYLVRNPRFLKKLVYLDGQQAVLDRSRMNPLLA